MSYKYIGIPQKITYKDCCKNNFVFAPSKYSRFLPQNKNLFVPLSSLCKESKSKIKIKREKEYSYTEIGDIDVSSGNVDYKIYYGQDLPSDNPKSCKKGDILISTVRTYRGGIGLVHNELCNHCCSPAILVVRSVTDERISKEYLLSVMRTDFFTEQILGLQTRGMYPRLDSDAMDKVLVPIPKEYTIIHYVTQLSKAYQNKIDEIRNKHKEILLIIKRELDKNQKPIAFKYAMPRISEIRDVGRLDASLYKEFYKKELFNILNYRGGYSPLTEQELEMIPGPSLELKLLGTRIDSDHFVKGFYRLITPKQITNYGVIKNEEFLGTPAKITRIKFGDILFGESGTGRTMVYLDDDNNTINNAHAHVLRSKAKNDLERIITIRSILQYYKEIGITDCMTVGGAGGHLSPSYFNRIMIPLFPKSIQEEIAKLYYNPQNGISVTSIDCFLDVDNFYNKKAGIYDLDRSAKFLKQRLNMIIDDIVNERPIDMKMGLKEIEVMMNSIRK